MRKKDRRNDPKSEYFTPYYLNGNSQIEIPVQKSYKKYYAMETDLNKKSGPAPSWTKRAGIIAFFFFLGKGLVWIGLAAAGAYYAIN